MMEEVRFASERHQEQAEKFGSEQAAIVSKRERIRNLED